MSKVDKSGEINCNISSNGNVKKKTHRTSKNSFREKNTKKQTFSHVSNPFVYWCTRTQEQQVDNLGTKTQRDKVVNFGRPHCVDIAHIID